MASKTALTELLKKTDVAAVESALSESSELLDYRDDKGRNWLHLAAGIDVHGKRIPPAQVIEMSTQP